MDHVPSPVAARFRPFVATPLAGVLSWLARLNRLGVEAETIALNGRLALTDPYAPLRWAARLGVDDSPMPVQYRRGVWG